MMLVITVVVYKPKAAQCLLKMNFFINVVVFGDDDNLLFIDLSVVFTKLTSIQKYFNKIWEVFVL